VVAGKVTERDFHVALLKENSIPVELFRAHLMKQKLTQARWRFWELAAQAKKASAGSGDEGKFHRVRSVESPAGSPWLTPGVIGRLRLRLANYCVLGTTRSCRPQPASGRCTVYGPASGRGFWTFPPLAMADT